MIPGVGFLFSLDATLINGLQLLFHCHCDSNPKVHAISLKT